MQISLTQRFVLAALVLGCGGKLPAPRDPDAPGAYGSNATLPSGRTFYIGELDKKRCEGSGCSGLFARAVNQTATSCSDGVRAADCAVQSLDLSALGLSDAEVDHMKKLFAEGRLLVRADFGMRDVSGIPVGVLRINQAWLATSWSRHNGPFYREVPSTAACVDKACASKFELLNVGLVDPPGDKLYDHDAFNKVVAENGRRPEDTPVLFGLPAPDSKCGLEERSCPPMTTSFYLRVEHTEAERCGGAERRNCGFMQYCAMKEGRCTAQRPEGKCTYWPLSCVPRSQPVCGCNAVTYASECEASRAAQSVQYQGACN